MDSVTVLNKLKRARRYLDSLSQVDILDDWQNDDKLNVWYLHIGITIEYKNDYFPKKSQWYVVVETDYPSGKIKIYPDVNNSITVTLYHQSNNSIIEKNGLWRSGALCLEKNTLTIYRLEPYTIDDRLLYHVERAVEWLELAAKNKLVTDDEPFELPDFSIDATSIGRFIFSEDENTYLEWCDTGGSYGVAELGFYNNPVIYYAKSFRSNDGSFETYTQWGSFLSKNGTENQRKALWVMLKRPPVINEWQAAYTFGDLINACKSQNVDIVEIFKKLFPKIRDGKRHLFLIGFPIQNTFSSKSNLIFWQALYLPVLSYGKKTKNGFRTNEDGRWFRDRSEIISKNAKIDWMVSENWNQKELSQRGKMNGNMMESNILIIGAGCIGASIAEILVRSGKCDITIMDFDLFEAGNLSRHVLGLKEIGHKKEVSLQSYLNSLNPHANIRIIEKFLKIENGKINVPLEEYDLIVDCTGENSVLDVFNKTEFERDKILASVSVGLGAKHLYITIHNGTVFQFDAFYELINPYIERDKYQYDDYKLPRDGIGCWHPTFPARSDDIWLSSSTATKVIDDYIGKNVQKSVSFVYEQTEKDGFFEGYKLVAKKEG